MIDSKLLTSWQQFDYSKESIQESRDRNNGKIILKGILQKSDTLNQNGRIYPRPILEREVRNYQKFIKENRALGECVDRETKIMTARGWLDFEDLKNDDIVYTLNIKTNELEEQKILHITNKNYSGKMLHFYNQAGTLDMKITPDHKVLLFDRNNNPTYMSALEVYNLYKSESSWLSHSSLRFRSNWNGTTPNKYTVPTTDLEFDPHVWAGFLGIYLSEGCVDGVKRGYKVSNNIQITQKKPKVVKQIRELLADTPLKWKESTRADGMTIDFHCNHKGLHDYLFQFGYSSQKYIPNDILGWEKEHLETLMTWLLLGDGRNRIIRGQIVREYCTTSPTLAEDVSKLFLKLGVGSNIIKYQPTDRPSPDYQTTGRMILEKNSMPMHIVSENKAKVISLDLRFMKIEEVEHNDKVYCVTTPNGNWMAKRNGKMFWTGNCDHPDSSVVELKNASHVIREAYMEGDICMGTVELLNTPSGQILQSLVESGITLGISSRGVGSTKAEGEYQVVQDDFQLICWDFVSEPSTPGAFMMREGREISANELKKIFNKSDRIYRIMNDIEEW